MDRRLGVVGLSSVRQRVMRDKALRWQAGRDQEEDAFASPTCKSASSELSGATDSFKQRSDMIEFHFR